MDVARDVVEEMAVAVWTMIAKVTLFILGTQHASEIYIHRLTSK